MNPTQANQLPVSYSDIQSASELLQGIAHKTPVMTSRTLNELTGNDVFLKCENYQRMGAFKFRGAYNAISRLTDEEKAKGVLTFSSGNHGQAIALSSKLLGVPATIIMPTDAPQVKLDAVRGYGAEVMLYDREVSVREILAQEIVQEKNMTLIPPYDHPHIVAGQGTAAKELFEEVGELDYLLVPCGGAGLLSGCALSAQALSPNCKVIGVEPEAGNDGVLSFQSGKLESVHNPKTIADGARTSSLGDITLAVVLAYVDTMTTATDIELIQSMKFVWERMKMIIEPTAALGLSHLFHGHLDATNKRVGVMISGGNVDLKQACEFFARLEN